MFKSILGNSVSANMLYSFLMVFFLMMNGSCVYTQQNQIDVKLRIKSEVDILPGAYVMDEYLALLEGRSVALLTNHTGKVNGVHLLDTLLARGVKITKVFAPEHGFRGIADAGEAVPDSRDKKTRIPVISMYGSNKKPKLSDLLDVDVVVFDIQDIGVRYFTYISSMHYMMEACAEVGIPFIVLDRPNPNGFYVAGPVLKKGVESFVGMHPIPLVHGLTVGELAIMINEEGWLIGNLKCSLTVIKATNYSHSDYYQLTEKPSPNLPTMGAVYLYPSLGLFEGTQISVGRGTQYPFQVIGHPALKKYEFSFTPVSIAGAKFPPHENKVCYGLNLSDIGANFLFENRRFSLGWFIEMYNAYPDKSNFFLKSNFFDLLIGDKSVKNHIVNGKTANEIEAMWEQELSTYKFMRKKYLLYEDFE